MAYSTDANHITLRPVDRASMRFELKMTVIDSRSEVLVRTRCITYEPVCRIRKRTVPRFDRYRTTHMNYWGIVEEPVKVTAAPTVTLTHR